MKLLRIKTKLSESLTKLTSYGIPHFLKSKNIFSQLFWLIYIIFGVGGSSWYIYDAITDYFKYDVVTKVESIYQQPLQFPTISFCAYGKNEFNEKNLKDLIISCWFNLDKDCENNPNYYFESFTNQINGQCYRFNSGQNLLNKSVPFLNSTTGGRDDSFFLNIKASYGLWVWVHEPASPPKVEDYNNHNGNAILVASGQENQLIIDKLVESKQGKPFNDCYKDVDEFEMNKTIIDYILRYKNEAYNQGSCIGNLKKLFLYYKSLSNIYLI